LSAYFYNNCGYFFGCWLGFYYNCLKLFNNKFGGIGFDGKRTGTGRVEARIENENLIKHSLAVEAIMRIWLFISKKI